MLVTKSVDVSETEEDFAKVYNQNNNPFNFENQLYISILFSLARQLYVVYSRYTYLIIRTPLVNQNFIFISF